MDEQLRRQAQVEIKVTVDDAQAKRDLNELNRTVGDGLADAAGKAKRATDDMQRALAQGAQRARADLVTERYALYDVASTATVTGASVLGLVTAYEAVAVAREKAFAQTRAASGFNEVTGQIEQLTGLKSELTALTREIPQGFGQLNATAVAGGQGGVSKENLANYVEAVTRFSTVAGMSADAAGEKLLKLDNILGRASLSYDGLAKSIAYAGVESAASAPQIIAVAEEIAPYATQMGFAATETIGLATALAGLQVPPERARSAFQDLSRSISAAVSVGGEQLANFAQISGVSAEQFATGWKTAPAETFRAFTAGFARVDDASKTLRVLGLDGERVAPTLLSLANNADLVAASFETANRGLSNGFLDAAFAATVETVAAQIQLLVNAFGELGDAVGGPTLASLSGFVQMLTKAVQMAADFANSPIGQALSIILTPMAAAAGGLLLIVGAGAAAGASILAMKTAFNGLGGVLPPAIANLINARLGIIGVNIAANEAAVGLTATAVATNVLRFALKALLVGTLVGAVIAGIGWIAEKLFGLDDAQKAAAEATNAATAALSNQGNVSVETAEDLQKAVDAANELALQYSDVEGSLYSLGQSMGKNGSSFTAYSEGGRANMRALQTTVSSLTKLAGNDTQALANTLLGLKQQLISAGAGAEALEMVDRAMAATGVSANEATVTSNSLAVGLQNVDKSADGARNSMGELIKEVRTVSDYASDLSSIFGRSIEIRFGSQNAYDGILSKYSSMRKEAKDASDKVADLRNQIRETEAEIAGIGASRKGLEYGLSIAGQYGDQIRSAQIASEIAKLNAQEQTDRTKVSDLGGQLTDAQNSVSRSLLGVSDAAIKNRADIESLVKSYQDYLVALANSGAGQEQIKAESERLRGEFVEQLTQMGFNRGEVDQFAQAFDDFTTIIQNFPRNVTLEADVDPATAALEEFLAKYRDNTVKVTVDPEQALATGTDAGKNVARGLLDGFGTEVKNWQAGLNSNYNNGSVSNKGPARASQYTGPTAFFDPGGMVKDFTNWFLKTRFDIFGYADGGYTGDGGKYQPVGVVHAGEYVQPQESVKFWGVETMAYMHRVAKRGYADGGMAGGTPGVGLGGMFGGGGPIPVQVVGIAASAADQLADAAGAHPVLLMADGRQLARAVGSGNASSSRSS